MAITLNFEWRGVMIPGAYVRIDYVRGGKRGGVTPQQQSEDQGVWLGGVGIYASAAEPVPFLTTDVEVPWVGEESPYGPLYAALKARPEFEGATDC